MRVETKEDVLRRLREARNVARRDALAGNAAALRAFLVIRSIYRNLRDRKEK